MLVLVLSLSWSAHADVVPPEPESCPAQGIPMTGHGGPYCAPPTSTCKSDEACGPGQTCVEVAYCTEERVSHGWTETTFTAISGECPDNGTCGDKPCEKAMVCAQAGDPSQEAPKEGDPPKEEPPHDSDGDAGTADPPAETPPPPEKKRCATVGGSAAFLGAILVPLFLRRRSR